jgi:hypothetical protein
MRSTKVPRRNNYPKVSREKPVFRASKCTKERSRYNLKERGIDRNRTGVIFCYFEDFSLCIECAIGMKIEYKLEYFGDEEEHDVGTPIALLLFDFLTDPFSSKYATAWSSFTIVLVLSRILEIMLESCYGPNQYYKRPEDLSHYKFLLTAPEYWKVYIAIMVPLIIDGFTRLLFLFLIIFEHENEIILERFKEDKMQIFLFVTDIIGLIPFFSYASYFKPNNYAPSPVAAVFLSVLELMLTGRVLRMVRKHPAIRTITRALTRSAEHLVLPCFFFFVFNISAGVFFYFSEPCYNVNLCPWQNLFDATFYSIVTMTTSKY